MFQLVVESPEGAEESFPVSRFPVVIGRDPGCDVYIKHRVLSRRHGRIAVEEGRLVLEDLGSTNGTLLNGEAVASRQVQPGDRIRIGPLELRVEPSAEDAGEPAPESVQPDAAPVESVMLEYHLSAATLPADLEHSLSPAAVDVAKAPQMFHALYRTSRKLGLLARLDDFLKASLEAVFDIIGAERGVILVSEAGPGGRPFFDPKFAYVRGRGFVEPDGHAPSTGLLRRAVESREALLVHDALQDARFNEQKSIVEQKARSILCAPLWDEESCFGAVLLESRSRPGAFNRDDRALLTAISNLVAIRIRQEALRENLLREERVRSDLARYHSPDVVEALLRDPAMLDAARRDVTVLFADVKNSTGIAERIGEEAVYRLLHGFYEIAAEAVFGRRGHLNKFIGDAALAVFNAPVEIADHAVRAVDAAGDIVRRVTEHGARQPDHACGVRIGVNTGWVIAGNLGPRNRLEYTVIGDAVNVTERLSKVETASPLGIVVGEETRHRLEGRFPGSDHGELPVKGRARPVRVYEVRIPME
jgi:adenylate cyclase